MKRITLLVALLWLCGFSPHTTAQDSISYQVQAIQYFFDQDPGFGVAGNGAVIALSPQDTINQLLNIVVPPAMPSGVHRLIVRVQDTKGLWSLMQRSTFFIVPQNLASPPPPTAHAGDVQAIQYFFNDDPGFGVAGNGAVMAVGPKDSVDQLLNIVVPPAMPSGVHRLIVRVQDTKGLWSLMQRSTFFIVPQNLASAPPTALSPQLTALEYYYDTDPGVGQANRINVAPTDTIGGLFSINTPCLVTGQHILYVRARNADGDWSLVDTDTLQVLSGTNISTMVSAAGALGICRGDSVKLEFTEVDGAAYEWLFNGAPVAGADTNFIFAKAAGTYQVKTTCNSAFTVSDSVEVSFLPRNLYFADKDGDGFGDATDTVSDCSQPLGFVTDSTDCNDNDSLVNPAEAEICNGVDDNCDGQVDEGLFVNGTAQVSICQGDSVLLGGSYRFASGAYPDTTSFNDACDSILLVTLTVNRNDTLMLAATTCDAGQAGLSYQTLTGSDGCDSIIKTIITFDPGSTTPLPNKTICQGDSALVFGKYENQARLFRDTLPNQNGCDSILECRLIVNRSDTVNVTVTTMDSTLAGVYDTTYTNTAGCDSLVNTTVTLVGTPCPPADTGTVSNITCDLAQAGTTYQMTTGTDGCDSVIATVTVFDPGSTTALASQAICAGESVDIFGESRTTAGLYRDTLQNQNGCDSILTVLLTVNPSYNDTLPAVTVCDGQSALVFGSSQTVAGFYMDNNSTANGCDSLTYQELLVLPSPTGTTTEMICDGDSLLLEGAYRFANGTFTDTLSGAAANGCDSILTTSLTVKPNVASAASDSICPGDSLLVGGAYQTMAGVYTDVFAASNGCDSTVTTTLSVRDSADCAEDTTGQSCLTVVSDGLWMQSTVVDPSNFSGHWPGSPGLPATASFTQAVMLGQPYGYPSIQEIENTEVIKTGNSVTYFRKEFDLASATDLGVRLLITVDDQTEIFLNGQRAALISSFGRDNYKFPAHDVKFGAGSVQNGFMGGDSYDVVATTASIDAALQPGTNEVVVVIRNLGKAHERGGFSFRMDINCDDNGITKKAAEADLAANGMTVFPNPAQDLVWLNSEMPIVAVQLFDLSGKLIATHRFDAEKQVALNLKGLADGLYLLRVEELGGTIHPVKIVKE